MNVHHNAEGFKGPSVVSQRFIDEAKKILSFVGVNPKAEDFFPRDSSWMKKEALAYIITVNLQKIAETYILRASLVSLAYALTV